MKRETGLFVAVFLLCAAVPLIGAQTKTRSELPPDVVGPQLIAWSEVQKPQPVPQPLPPPNRPEQPDAQPEQPASAPPQAAQPTPQAAQTFTGTIEKSAGTYVLKVSANNAYQLDDQEKAKQYEGKRVKISGALDAKGDILHVASIELLS